MGLSALFSFVSLLSILCPLLWYLHFYKIQISFVTYFELCLLLGFFVRVASYCPSALTSGLLHTNVRLHGDTQQKAQAQLTDLVTLCAFVAGIYYSCAGCQ